jgi:hypothetical protein
MYVFQVRFAGTHRGCIQRFGGRRCDQSQIRACAGRHGQISRSGAWPNAACRLATSSFTADGCGSLTDGTKITGNRSRHWVAQDRDKSWADVVNAARSATILNNFPTRASVIRWAGRLPVAPMRQGRESQSDPVTRCRSAPRLAAS